jgi:hypothetical protein
MWQSLPALQRNPALFEEDTDQHMFWHGASGEQKCHFAPLVALKKNHFRGPPLVPALTCFALHASGAIRSNSMRDVQSIAVMSVCMLEHAYLRDGPPKFKQQHTQFLVKKISRKTARKCRYGQGTCSVSSARISR